MAKYDKYLSCGECKPSEWTFCPQCGRQYCKHKGCAVCDDCFKAPRMPEPIEAGERSVRIWRTPYGSYSTQPNRGYYTRKDAQEWSDAAQALKLGHALVDKYISVKGHDWYGRPTHQGWSEYALWVVSPSAKATQGLYDAVAAIRRDKQIERLEEICGTPKAEWSYKDHEDWHRMAGTLR